jgi:fatty acid synthase subunit alpha
LTQREKAIETDQHYCYRNGQPVIRKSFHLFSIVVVSPSRSRSCEMVDGVKDEPVKDLGNINKALTQRLLERKYGGDKSAVPTIDYLAVQSKAVPNTLPGITRIVSVTNSSEGKVVKVKGYCYCNDQPVIEVVSSFFYRGRFVDSDYENTFDTTEEPDYLVHLEGDADVGVLQSKEWFDWDDMSPSLLAGTSLIFRIQSQVSFKDKTTYRNVSVSGDIFVQNQLKVLVKVGSVDFQRDDSQGNPVLAYLQLHGTPQGLTTPLSNGYSLNTPDVNTTFNAPLTNELYSKISGDFNPIHVNPYFSDFASLPATITHGLWSSAATRCYVESIEARGHPDCMIA